MRGSREALPLLFAGEEIERVQPLYDPTALWLKRRQKHVFILESGCKDVAFLFKAPGSAALFTGDPAPPPGSEAQLSG